jgi:protein ImuB
LRVLERAEEIEAGFPIAPDGPPKFFVWRQCRRDVVRAEGPERIAMEWWRSVGESRSDQQKSAGLTRDYFRVETGDGQRFWLYRDGLFQQNGLHPRWYLYGLFA